MVGYSRKLNYVDKVIALVSTEKLFLFGLDEQGIVIIGVKTDPEIVELLYRNRVVVLQV